ncbi:hypothetical protein [Niabella ginsengisoli]|uniref:Carboxypeptidase regulatory-like domain-containing protein n=1 Tax=Niabella ginsengisoli TaxID=522298 RepID=A0ABS9SQ49_9BACT|nr:hypothetical protein [Niabella ginsengisoli]MCH5600513.1 hypothetical protein [Niabella ginsengisoli]
MLSLIMTLSIAVFAQKSNGNVKGVIYDSINDYALQSASISVFKEKDSSVVEFQLSNTSGEFDIKNLPISVPLYMIITHTGYRSLVKNLMLDSSQMVKDYKKYRFFKKPKMNWMK